jgi:hypothetical protein
MGFTARALILIFGVALAFAVRAGAAGQRSAESDRRELADLEEEWLHARDAATLERILAADFVHPVASGDFLTKAQHIEWFVKHPSPPSVERRFAEMTVRLYGDAGVVTGTVVATDRRTGKESRSVFTDVFAYCEGRWQAVNAQENAVAGGGKPATGSSERP